MLKSGFLVNFRVFVIGSGQHTRTNNREVAMELIARIAEKDFQDSGGFSYIHDDELVGTVHGGMFVRLRRTSEEGEMLIPQEIVQLNHTLYLQAEEWRNRSNGTIVSGISGRALAANSAPAFGSAVPNVQAYFFAPIAIVTVTGGWKSEDVLIVEHRAVKEKASAWIQEKVLYAGDAAGAPSEFREASRAARKKANCPGCRHIHFKKE